MSAPTFVAAGNTTQSTTAATVVWPTGHQTDDIGILFVQTSNEDVTAPVGWTLVGNCGTGAVGAVGSTALWVFWKRAASAAEANVTVADAGDHVKCAILVFRGCENAASPIDVVATATLNTASTACSMPSVTTLGADRYVVASVANGTEVSGNQTTAGGFSNANLTGLVRVITSNTTLGHGGGVDGAGGTKAAAGAVGATTVTLANASLQAMVTFALKPPAGGGGGTVTNGGIYVATGTKPTAGVVNTTTVTLDQAAAQGRLTIALKPPASAPPNLPPVIEPITDKVATVGVELSFALNITDPEAAAMTVTLQPGATAVPTGATIVTDPEGGALSFDWTPDSTQVGEWNIAVQASDGTNTVQALFTIVVNDVPPGPVIISAFTGGLVSIT